MKTSTLLIVLGSCTLAWAAEPAAPAPAAPAAAAPAPAAPIPGANGWKYVDLRSLAAPEARQGVAADREHLYIISNFAIGKYRKDTGQRVASWECPEGEPLTHLNAGIVHEGRLYCAHSNYPGVPNLSSVEIWDTATLQHVGSRSFGRADGSLTWVERRNGRWIACFVHYGKRGGEPGKGPEWTRIVEFDDEWRQTGGWAFPADLMARLGVRGYSCSGGAFGPGGYLFVTGHDHTELYVLQMPEAGPTLRWVATIPVTAQGQAFAWDPDEPEIFYSLSKKGRTVLVGRVTPPEQKP
ncbi:MAG: hypothetical protein JNG83_14460 [Opitutaceae bacterium]|nr:hypothetical protein [Opitutaceae bacterium]